MASDNKYDRQLRLWGSEGQRAVQEASVLCIGSDSIATEVLKNLILPGVGRVTVADDAIVTEVDLHDNFFVTESDIGSSRASTTFKYLCELNEDVEGEVISESPVSIVKRLSESPMKEIAAKYSLILTTQLPWESEQKLRIACLTAGVPFVSVLSSGLLGRVRTSFDELEFMQTHSKKKIFDLYVTAPFAELQAFADSFFIEELSMYDALHVPYPVLLIKALAAWQDKHRAGDRKALPTKFAERSAFLKDHLQPWLVERLEVGAESYNEALENYAMVGKAPALTDDLEALVGRAAEGAAVRFQREAALKEMGALKGAQRLAARATDFWVCVAAVKSFFDAQGRLPASSALPDMHASTANFLKMKSIFKERHDADIRIMQEFAVSVIEGRPVPSTEFVSSFIKCCRTLKVIGTDRVATLPLAERDLVLVKEILDNCSGSPAIMEGEPTADGLFALEAFHRTGLINGETEELVAAASAKAAEMEGAVIAGLSCPPDEDRVAVSSHESVQNYLVEAVRGRMLPIHTVSSIIGAETGQEIIKLIARQFQAEAGTWFWDGLYSKAISVRINADSGL